MGDFRVNKPFSYEPPILKGGKIPQEMFDRFPYKKIERNPT